MSPMAANITGVDFSRLIERLVPSCKFVNKYVGPSGVAHQFTCAEPRSTLSAIIAVYPEEGQATEAANRQVTMTSIGPTGREKLEHGVLILWQSPNPAGGSLLLRHGNVVIRLNHGLSWDARVTLMKRIDKDLEEGTPEITRGEITVPPTIVSVKVPQQIAPGEVVHCEMQIGGMPGAEAIFGSNSSHVIFQPGTKPGFTYYAARETGEEELQLILATPGNLISVKTLKISVR